MDAKNSTRASRPPAPSVQVVESEHALAGEGALWVLQRATEALRERGAFRIALAGGDTPRGLYARIAAIGSGGGVDFAHWQVYFGDERCVPPDHADSNYRMAREALLDAAPIPPAHVHRVRTEEGPPEQVAERYERELEVSFGVQPPQRPRFDAVLLGLGADGHTASLLPESAACAEERRLVAAVWHAGEQRFRITLTPPAFNAARAVLFLVSGEDKAEALRAVLASESTPQRLPGRLVAPVDGELAFLVDRSAASRLEGGYERK